jgi:hypothetical protein
MLESTMKRSLLAVALLMSAVAGCNQGEVPIGGGGTLVGEWDGYLENTQFPSGSDAVHMSIVSASSSGVQGTITFGEPATFPTPTDPDAGYPVPVDVSCFGPNAPIHRLPIEGFEYSILDSTVTDLRMRFGVDREELWAAWCELQTPIHWYEDSYACVPRGADGSLTSPDTCILYDGAMETEVDCCKHKLCNDGTCGCSETSCMHSADPAIRFDVKVDGDEADGSFLGPYVDGYMRLTRSP